MTIHDIPNIEHCDLEPIGTRAYRVRTHEGWYIRKATDLFGGTEENPTIQYYTVAIIALTEDMSGIEVVHADDLPSNAEICGDVNDPDHETM